MILHTLNQYPLSFVVRYNLTHKTLLSIILWISGIKELLHGCRFVDPLMFGDYPSSMRSRVGSRLPKFCEAESTLLKGSLDFVGINHYTTWYAMNGSSDTFVNDSIADIGAITLSMLFMCNTFTLTFY